jgi:hypothetical protein
MLCWAVAELVLCQCPVVCPPTLPVRISPPACALAHSDSECVPALTVAGNTGFLNGQPKHMDVYEFPLGASLVLTALRLNATTADGAIIGFRSVAPCNQPKYLFRRPYDNPSLPIEYAFSESSGHACCGRNW